jgi:hypothetical protein
MKFFFPPLHISSALLLNLAFHTTRPNFLAHCTMICSLGEKKTFFSLLFRVHQFFTSCFFLDCIFLVHFGLLFSILFLFHVQSLCSCSTGVALRCRLRNPKKFRAAKFMNATNSGSPFAKFSFSTDEQNVLWVLSLTRSKAVLSEKMWVRGFLYSAI